MTATAPAASSLTAKGLAHNLETSQSVDGALAGHEGVIQAKLDGIRLLAHVTEDGAFLYARSGNSKSGKLPHVEASLAENLPAGTWLDGEAVVFNSDGTQAWGKAQSVLGANPGHSESAQVAYVVFDLIAHGGIDARPLPFSKRRELLKAVFAQADFDSSVVLIPQAEASEEAHEDNLANGFEGSVVKHLDAPYRSGVRGAGQFRLKPQATVDAVVMGFKDGKSSFEGLVGALVFGQFDPATGKLVERGACSGFDFQTRVDITNHKDAWLGRVIEVAHHGAMPPTAANPHGALRHPQFKRTRTDKDAMECVLDNG